MTREPVPVATTVPRGCCQQANTLTTSIASEGIRRRRHARGRAWPSAARHTAACSTAAHNDAVTVPNPTVATDARQRRRCDHARSSFPVRLLLSLLFLRYWSLLRPTRRPVPGRPSSQSATRAATTLHTIGRRPSPWPSSSPLAVALHALRSERSLLVLVLRVTRDSVA